MRFFGVLFNIIIAFFSVTIAAAGSFTVQDDDVYIATTSGNHGLFFQDKTEQLTAAAGLKATEVMVSSADVTSSVASVTITLPVGTKTPYRVVFALQKDATAGVIAVYANGDTTSLWSFAKYGRTVAGATGISDQTHAGCWISHVSNNLDANSFLQGQFYITSQFQNDKVALVYGLETSTNGDNGNVGWESGGCLSVALASNISSIRFGAVTGNISLMHWELWQGVTHQ